MEDVDVSAQMWRSFTQWELGNNSSALRRKVGIMFIIAISFDLYYFLITINRFQELTEHIIEPQFYEKYIFI